MSSPDILKQYVQAGQSIWIDYIRRNMFASGELRKMIDAGLRGMTSNPTIFEKAIGAGNDYDAQLRDLIASERDPIKLFEALAIEDIRHACDEFRSLYDSTGGADGFVSLEVSPLLAHDTQGTIAAAKRLWAAVDRPNVMIKIPGTPEGVPAIEESIASGININVTLLFSIDRYEAAANAYIRGIQRRIDAGQPVDKIASVASVFVSRIDSAIDKLLQAKIEKGDRVQNLLGKAGIANLKLTYQRFQQLFEGDAFKALAAKGAHVQRPLWASTSTKNPAYPDLMYVENVIGPHTVNTVPPTTYDALLDHGVVKPNSVTDDLAGARATIEALAAAQISLYDVTENLTKEGVESFAASFDAMLKAIAGKQQQLAEGTHERVRLSLGNEQAKADAAVAALQNSDFLSKLWKKDPTPWSSDPAHEKIIKNALGWLDIADTMKQHADELRAFASECAKQFDNVVVLGMGGSSLAPDVLRVTFGRIAGYPQLHILDSSDPEYVRALDEALDVRRSLFIVASKSGTTTEPDAFYRHYYALVQKAVGAEAAGDHFIAITDPGTKLADEAKAMGFRRAFINAADIGGRYSALSYFGMVPAALAGYDIAGILDRALGMEHGSRPPTSVGDVEGVRFGAAFGALAKAGKDKLTIITHPRVHAFGAWAEQLIAESTGKMGTGIIPIEDEPLGSLESYGDDRVFVYVGEGLPNEAPEATQLLTALEAAGKPVIRLRMNDPLDIGEQFYLWEIATAAAGSVLGIDAFDQPNVQESKDNTVRILGEYKTAGKLSEPPTALDTNGVAVIPLSGSKSVNLGGDLESALAAIVAQVKPGDYVALNAYVPMTAEHIALLHKLRGKIRDALKVATTVGFGPRFLHSTGQLHKGGPNSGVFLMLTYDAPVDIPIPGYGIGFRTLERAQALGDFESLDRRERRGARFNLADLAAGLDRFSAALDDAVSAKA